jgi:hypothetical protein
MAVAAIGVAAGLHTGAQEGQTIDCIPVQRIDHTEVLDDRTILFVTRDRDAYVNQLKTECPGLERERRFMYEVKGAQLCSIDTISVLEQWGVGPMRGATCALGSFRAVSKDEVENLHAPQQKPPSGDESNDGKRRGNRAR